jgi:hypothetical protein
MCEDVPDIVQHFQKNYPNTINILSHPIVLDPETFSHIPFISLPEKNLCVV